MKKITQIEKIKADILPWVTDWHDPQNQVRHNTNVRAMKYWDWFWCHPSAYKLIYYGIPGSLAFISIISLFIIMRFSVSEFFLIIPILALAFSIFNILKKIKNRADIKETTFYDLHMREYDEVLEDGS